MPFYKGKTADGSDMEEIEGFYISEDGNQWSSEPYPIHKQLRGHLKYVNLSLKEAHQLMLEGKSKASKRVQKYLIANYHAMNPQNR